MLIVSGKEGGTTVSLNHERMATRHDSELFLKRSELKAELNCESHETYTPHSPAIPATKNVLCESLRTVSYQSAALYLTALSAKIDCQKQCVQIIYP